MAAPYTLTKLTEVEDSARKFGFAEVQQARLPLTSCRRRTPA